MIFGSLRDSHSTGNQREASHAKNNPSRFYDSLILTLALRYDVIIILYVNDSDMNVLTASA